MRFEHSYLFWLSLVLVPPVLIVFFWWAERTRQRLLTQFVEARLLASLTAGLSLTRRKIRYILMVIAVTLLFVALARPQHGFDLQEIQQRGLDVIVAVDTSKSMLATDIAPNRLARAKMAALELMQRAATDRLGLVAFAGDAFLSCPLTIDNTAFQQSVQALDVNSIPQGGTALAAAINTALTAFKEKGSHKALVLLTDGEDNDEGALEAAQTAAKAGLKIYTIGIGSADGMMITVSGENGNTDYLRDDQGQVLKSKLNEPLLQQIAADTGGFYLPLRGADTMDTLYERGLSQLPKSEEKEKLVRRYHEQFQWPLGLAIALLLAELLLPERRSVQRKAGGKAVAAKAAAVLLLLGWLMPSGVQASPGQALKDYQAGNFTNALQEYTRLAAVYTNDLRLVFNAGTAAYRGTNFDLAKNLFSQVTLSPDLKLQQQAYYNWGNTQFQIAKQSKDLDGLEAGFQMAADIYAKAVNLNTNDTDAVYNFNFSKNAVLQIKQFKEAMRRAKGDADAAVRRAEFHRALEIMAPLQKTLAAKQFEEFTKKLKDIDDIATPPPSQPQP
jgi:Ca-activated chloride channel homolog